MISALRGHKIRQLHRYQRLGLASPGTDAFVFDRLDGQIWNPNELSRAFSRLVRRKNLKAVRLHDLRHAFASFAFDAGVPLKVVSESLGHSSIAITSGLYVHLLDNTKKEKAERLNAYFSGALGNAEEGIHENV